MLQARRSPTLAGKGYSSDSIEIGTHFISTDGTIHHFRKEGWVIRRITKIQRLWRMHEIHTGRRDASTCHDLPLRPPREERQALGHRRIHFGIDGSLLFDDGLIYVLYEAFHLRCRKVDYFHGQWTPGGEWILQTNDWPDDREDDYPACGCLSRSVSGFVVNCIRRLQRRWRRARSARQHPRRPSPEERKELGRRGVKRLAE